jgi:hypothetical protein
MEIHYATLVNNAVSQCCVSMTHSLNSQFTRAARGVPQLMPLEFAAKAESNYEQCVC